MGLIETAQDYKKILLGPPIVCPCGERWFSPFDRLYVSAYSKCTTCSTVEEIDELSGNIFAIIEAL